MTAPDPVAGRPADAPLLAIDDLRVWFPTAAGTARAVDGVSLAVGRGETLGVVGESGCGKTVTALSILRLLPPAARIQPGSTVRFDDTDLLTLPDADLRRIRGNRVAMVFQEPMTALNPVFTAGDQIAEVARIHAGDTRSVAWARAVDMLARMGVPAAANVAHRYPHQLSGGMRQRVMLAMALLMHPALLIADEPTTALDVTVQAQILELLRDLQRRSAMSLLLITHDLGVVAEMASRVMVMYAGQIVETSPVVPLFAAPGHPYTEGLLRAMPRVLEQRRRLTVIPGAVPPATAWPDGCRFRERCPHAWARCATEVPPLYPLGDGRAARCHLVVEPARRRPTPAPAPVAV
jgi:peptide/nickel transport system ATP-binding protein